jgi:hypothetical protein
LLLVDGVLLHLNLGLGDILVHLREDSGLLLQTDLAGLELGADGVAASADAEQDAGSEDATNHHADSQGFVNGVDELVLGH